MVKCRRCFIISFMYNEIIKEQGLNILLVCKVFMPCFDALNEIRNISKPRLLLCIKHVLLKQVNVPVFYNISGKTVKYRIPFFI